MSNAFLLNYMRAAKTITRAERCLAMDSDLQIQDRINIDDTLLTSKSFSELVSSTVKEAVLQGEAIITNNLFNDPSEAPNTNVHLHDLRMIVAIPLISIGVVYLDQHVRQGVFQRDTIDKLALLATQVINSGRIDLTEDELTDLFKRL